MKHNHKKRNRHIFCDDTPVECTISYHENFKRVTISLLKPADGIVKSGPCISMPVDEWKRHVSKVAAEIALNE